jgi:SAM-dependent methyltransferase
MHLTALHNLLRSPFLYIRWQRMLGAHRLRQICLDEFLQLREGERVLDIGCGPGYILDYMPRVDYVGFDTEPRYIEYAREHYLDRGSFFCEPFAQRHVARLKPFDAIMLMGIVHHVDDAVAQDLLCLLAKCLAPNGRVVTLDPCFTPSQSRVARWVAKADRGEFVRDEQAYRRLGADQFSDVDAHVVNNVCRIPSTELIMRLGRPNVPQSIQWGG